ncbi:hypothetical protein LCGC14_1938760, partial [marine sediment metagenome]
FDACIGFILMEYFPIDGGDLISQLTSQSFCWTWGKNSFRSAMVGKAYPDEGY